jgi:hypothetical protein
VSACLKRYALDVQPFGIMRIPVGRPEAIVEDHLVAGVAALGGWAAKMVDKGRRGAPDRECRFPGPVTIFVETKARRGVLKPWQAEYHVLLRELGYTVLTLWTIEQVDGFLNEMAETKL